MVHENPTQRPSASTLLHHPFICPDATKSKAQLRKELNREKFKNEMLQRKVKAYEETISKLDSPILNQQQSQTHQSQIRLLQTQTSLNSGTEFCKIKNFNIGTLNSSTSSASKFVRSYSSTLI